MKFLMEARLSTQAVNAKLKDGSMMEGFKQYLGEVKPEVAYFSISHGKRTLFMVVNIFSAEKMPEIAEPLWLDYEAEVFVTQVMDAHDFEKAGPGIARVLKSRA